MAGKTTSERIIVLRKTKLGETDLIITGLAADGSQIRCVAKGARKPSSSFAARLELYAVDDVVLAQTKGLAIVREARLVDGHAKTRSSMPATVAAAPMMELLDKTTQPDLPVDRLFDLTQTALKAMDDADEDTLAAVCAAHLLKALAMLGLRPETRRCVVCGAQQARCEDNNEHVSFLDGGVVCPDCSLKTETVLVSSTTVGWVEALLCMTFSEITSLDCATVPSFDVLSFISQWVKSHLSTNLKSLDFLMVGGAF